MATVSHRNWVLDEVERAVAESAERLPLEFSLELDADIWAELWKRGVKNREGKELPRCAAIRFLPGAFRVLLSEIDTGDPPQDEVH